MPPKYVLDILKTLTARGFEARMVGGCVRDTLMRRRPNDWDIATSAAPEQIIRSFRRTVPTGIQHGTVTVLYGGGKCEVTTYRVESAYSDHRRPDSVRFTSQLAEDLSRRDFTINAMAMDAAGAVTDLFGGREDISRKTVRCVGDPEVRFTEDALRMLRAVRFAAKLDFGIDSGTLAAMESCAHLASALSAERVAHEVLGVLASRRPDAVWDMVSLRLLDAFISPGEGGRTPLSPLPVYARLAHWCLDLERSGYIMSTRDFLRSLRLDRRTIATASAAVEAVRSGSKDFKRLLRDYGEAAVRAAYPRSRRLRAVLRSGECWSLSSLAIGGDDAAALGFSGRETGDVLRRALDHVIDFPEDNEHDVLCKLIKEGRI